MGEGLAEEASGPGLGSERIAFFPNFFFFLFLFVFILFAMNDTP